MLSFSNQVKEEICATINDLDKQFACLYGILLFSRHLRQDTICIQSENAALSQLVPKLFRAIFHDTVQVQCATRERGDATVYQLSVDNPDQVHHVLQSYQITLPTRSLQMDNIVRNSLSVFTAGAFLSCGSVTDPHKEYHLEFSMQSESLYGEFSELLSEIGVTPRLVTRKKDCVLYIKSSEQIEDLLTFMGAQQSTIDYINVEILKNVRNKANRIINCDLANINKVMQAAERQINDILLIDEHLGLDTLSEELRDIALLRLENPELSLKELGELLETPIGRSGVNHRLMKLSKQAEMLRKEGKKLAL